MPPSKKDGPPWYAYIIGPIYFILFCPAAVAGFIYMPLLHGFDVGKKFWGVLLQIVDEEEVPK